MTTREDLGKIAYEAACKVTGCTQPWSEANQEKWIAAGVAVHHSAWMNLREICVRRIKKLRESEASWWAFPAGRFVEASHIKMLIDRAANRRDNDLNETTAKSLHEPLRATDGA
jgi:hypothetical protein